MVPKHTHSVNEAEIRRSSQARKSRGHFKEYLFSPTSAKGFQNWADQVPIVVAPLNYVLYIGAPLDGYDSDTAQQSSKLRPKMIHLPEQSILNELDGIKLTTKHGVFVYWSAATKTIGPLMGLYLLAVTLACLTTLEPEKCNEKETNNPCLDDFSEKQTYSAAKQSNVTSTLLKRKQRTLKESILVGTSSKTIRLSERGHTDTESLDEFYRHESSTKIFRSMVEVTKFIKSKSYPTKKNKRTLEDSQETSTLNNNTHVHGQEDNEYKLDALKHLDKFEDFESYFNGEEEPTAAD